MVTTGAITNRIDRLAVRGLVERSATDDRRKVMVRLTKAGVELVDAVVASHMATEDEILASLSARQRKDIAAHLKSLLLGLDDTP